MSIALVPGSFDPMTMGHLSLIRRVAEKYDEVIVAVMVNPAKRYCYDIKTRVEIAKMTVHELPNVRVIADKGMLIQLYDRVKADIVCKGWRNRNDYVYELKMADWNKAHNPNFKTELIQSVGKHSNISSTEVRGMLKEGKSPEEFVHPNALPLILAAYHDPDSGRKNNDF